MDFVKVEIELYYSKSDVLFSFSANLSVVLAPLRSAFFRVIDHHMYIMEE
jgi:hypothetical protein